jgi:hypothetical protein
MNLLLLRREFRRRLAFTPGEDVAPQQPEVPVLVPEA